MSRFENMEDAFRKAASILGQCPDALAWVQFQFEMDKDFHDFEKYLDGGFGRRAALFMFAPDGMGDRMGKVVEAAERAHALAEKIRRPKAATQ